MLILPIALVASALFSPPALAQQVDWENFYYFYCRHYPKDKRCVSRQNLPHAQETVAPRTPELPETPQPSLSPKNHDPVTPEPSHQASNPSFDRQSNGRKILRDLGVQLIIEPNVSPQEAEDIIAVAARELGLYESSFLRTARLEKLIIAEKIEIKNNPLASRPAFPDVHNNSLKLNKDLASKNEYIAHVVHHEFFHMIDYAMAEKKNGFTSWTLLKEDKAWHSLNPRNFKYGNGGETMRQESDAQIRMSLSGFINRYSTASLLEDKAELFAFRMKNSPDLEQRESNDPIIRSKLALLKQQLVGLCKNRCNVPSAFSSSSQSW